MTFCVPYSNSRVNGELSCKLVLPRRHLITFCSLIFYPAGPRGRDV